MLNLETRWNMEEVLQPGVIFCPMMNVTPLRSADATSCLPTKLCSKDVPAGRDPRRSRDRSVGMWLTVSQGRFRPFTCRGRGRFCGPAGQDVISLGSIKWISLLRLSITTALLERCRSRVSEMIWLIPTRNRNGRVNRPCACVWVLTVVRH